MMRNGIQLARIAQSVRRFSAAPGKHSDDTIRSLIQLGQIRGAKTEAELKAAVATLPALTPEGVKAFGAEEYVDRAFASAATSATVTTPKVYPATNPIFGDQGIAYFKSVPEAFPMFIGFATSFLFIWYLNSTFSEDGRKTSKYLRYMEKEDKCHGHGHAAHH